MSEDRRRKAGGAPRWLEDVPDKPARIPLSRRRIVTAAMAVVEEQGLETLTMRRVATELGVSTMALYNHIADKAELIDLMVDLIVGEVVGVETEGEWDEQLRAITRRYHEAWSDHPGFARVYTEGVTIGPKGLANMERVIRILREAGFSNSDAGAAFLVLFHYSISSLLVAPVKAVDPAERDSRSDGTTDDQIRRYFGAVPASEIPNTLAVAAYVAGGSFDFGLEMILVGLRQRLADEPGGREAKVAN